jgi:hypothetical protein
VETWDGFLVKSSLGGVEVGLLDCGSVMVRLHNVIKVVTFEEMSLIPCLLDLLGHRLSLVLSTCRSKV